MNKRGYLLSALTAGVFGLTAAVTPARADDAATTNTEAWWGALAGSGAIMSDYVFRGISQTQGHPALQGSLEYTHSLPMDLTVYGGTFISNISFPDTTNNTDLPIHYEVDLDAGLRGSVADFNWDVGYIRINYPWAKMPRNNSLDYDWSEVYLKGNYDFGVLKAIGGWWHSWKYSSDGGKSNYLSGEVDVPTHLYDITAVGHVGHLWLQDEVNFGIPAYTDWSLGINRDCPELLGVNVSLTYYDTNVKKGQALTNSTDTQRGTIDKRFYDTTTGRIVLAVTKTF
jgi:uncharacterized protein (TIGR02001 family)